MQVVQIILWYLDSGCSKLDLEEWMASVRISSGPEPFMMTPGQLNSGLATSHVPATTNIPPTDKDLEILFQPMCLLESVNRVLERQKKLRNQIFRALTASADVPSSVTETTDTTSTLQPPPNPLTKTYRSSEIIGRKLKDQNISNASLVEDSEILATQTNQRSE
ncbi:hypothetical protein Tco_0441308 [Tanacetum coccineum]